MALGRGEVGYTLEQARVPSGTYFGRPKLPMVAGLNLSAKLQGHGLHAITNTKYGKATLKDKFGGLIGMVVVGARMTARENDAFDGMSVKVSLQPIVGHVAGVDLAVNVKLAQAPGNELREL
jgi:hypothetical protein